MKRAGATLGLLPLAFYILDHDLPVFVLQDILSVSWHSGAFVCTKKRE